MGTKRRMRRPSRKALPYHEKSRISRDVSRTGHRNKRSLRNVTKESTSAAPIFLPPPPLGFFPLFFPRPAMATASSATTPPAHWSRFDQEQDIAVRDLIRQVTDLDDRSPETSGHFQAALNFAWSNFRSVRRARGTGGGRRYLVSR